MERDIRKLFNGDHLEGKKLPADHRTEFTNKLKSLKTEKPKKRSLGIFLRIAASLALLVAVGYYITNQKGTEIKRPTSLELQVQQIEKQYLQQIDDEWQSFIKLTDDQKLIDKYHEKLNDLDENYKELSADFIQTPNNIAVLEDLISNLKTRLQLLKDIQNHIKILNEKSKTYETVIL